MPLQVLLLDNYDSFTYMLKDYVEQCGATCSVVRNDELGILEQALKADAIVISPGPKTPKEAGQLMDILPQIAEVKPILGICLGHQAIGEFFGASLGKAAQPKHGKVETITHSVNPLFIGVDEKFEATRYHSLILRNIPDDLDSIAFSMSKEVMAVAHKTFPIWGVQFHPESCTTTVGLSIIKNFLRLAELYL